MGREDHYTIVIQGSGSSVVKGSMTVSVDRSEVEKLIVKGFFGTYPLEEALLLKPSRGFRTMGLPYETEPSTTKHLAHFLEQANYFRDKKGVEQSFIQWRNLKTGTFPRSNRVKFISLVSSVLT